MRQERTRTATGTRKNPPRAHQERTRSAPGAHKGRGRNAPGTELRVTSRARRSPAQHPQALRRSRLTMATWLHIGTLTSYLLTS
eukprot:13308785-Alexandrium_andersonii.AAC.1